MVAVALIVLLCVVGAVTGIRLVDREVMDAASWGLIALWAALAVAVVAVLLRRGRAERAGSSGDG